MLIKNSVHTACGLSLLATLLTCPPVRASEMWNESHLAPWRFWQGVGTEGTPFCGLQAATAEAASIPKTIQIKSFNGKPSLSIDLYAAGWTMPNHTHVPVSFNATSANPLQLDTISVSTVLDVALPRYQLPDLLAALDIPQVLKISFPSLDVPVWAINPGMNQSEIHKFVRCLNKQPPLRGLQ